MAVVSYANTYGVIVKLKKDLDVIQKVVDFVVQIIFLGFYAYSIYSNLNNTLLLTIYIVLLSVSLAYFIFYIVTLNNKSKIFKRKIKYKVKKSVKYTKLLTSAITLGLAVYELVNYETSDFTKILTIVSGISFGVQILIEFATMFVNKYVDLFTESIKMDYEESELIKNTVKTISKAKDIKENPLGELLAAVDIIPEKLSNKKNNTDVDKVVDELTPEQRKTREKIEKYKEPIVEAIEQKKELDAQKKQEKIEKEKKELKNHLKSIFSKKK